MSDNQDEFAQWVRNQFANDLSDAMAKKAKEMGIDPVTMSQVVSYEANVYACATADTAKMFKALAEKMKERKEKRN